MAGKTAILRRARRRLIQIQVRNQHQQGVIPSLQGPNTRRSRRDFIRSMKTAVRDECTTGPGWDGKGAGFYYHSVFSGDFEHVPRHVFQVIAQKGKCRYLDLGAGEGFYLHTLLGQVRNAFPGSKPEEKLEAHSLTLANVGQNRSGFPVKNRHVGPIETVNVRSWGKFDVIISSLGAVLHARYPLEVIQKVAGLLEVKGTAYLEISMTAFEPAIFGEKARALKEQFLRRSFSKLLGANFHVDKIGNEMLVFTRIQ